MVPATRRPLINRNNPDRHIRTALSAACAPLCVGEAPQIATDYVLGEQIGRGSFAVVLEATDTRTGEQVAAKKLPRFVHGRLASQQAAVVGAEADAQRAVSAACPAVLRLRDVRQDATSFFLISDLCVTDLAHWLAEHNGGPVGERLAAHITHQLLQGLAACHSHGIAFRDVKPANLLVRGFDADGMPQLALSDFGCCRSTADPQPFGRSSAGTPLYSPPESLHSAGGCEGDVWAAGVLLFHLLSGKFPFCDPRHRISQGEYWRRVAEAPIHTVGPAWARVSPGAVALVRAMLDRDCSSRITAEQALQDPWLLAMTSSSLKQLADSSCAAAAALRSRTAPKQLQQQPALVGNVLPGLPGLAASPHHVSV